MTAQLDVSYRRNSDSHEDGTPSSCEFPDLPKIKAPIGALAVFEQRLCHRPIQRPRNFASRDGATRGVPTHVLEPDRRVAARWFCDTYDAFNAAHTPLFAVAFLDVQRLLRAETKELLDHTRRVDVGTSLPPRALGLWVLVSGQVAQGPTGRSVLDAVAHWCPTIVHSVRVTVVAGKEELQWLDDETERERNIPGRRLYRVAPQVRVQIRWVSGSRLCCASAPMDDVVTSNAILATMQKCVIMLAREHGLLLPAELLAVISTNVPADEWNMLHKQVADKFSSRLRSPDSVTLSNACKARGTGGCCLHTFDAFARVYARGGHRDASTSFHGVLLAPSQSSAKRTLPYVGGKDEIHGLRAPSCAAHDADLHLCAVHTDIRPLGCEVTLYAQGGRPGQPVVAHVYMQSAAIRPINSSLLAQFCVVVCRRASVLPQDNALTAAQTACLKLASDLYTSLTTATSAVQVRTHCAQPHNVPTIERFVSTSSAPAETLDDVFFSCASKKMRLDEAYANARLQGAPQEVQAVILHACSVVGVSAGTDDVLTALTRLATECHTRQREEVSMRAQYKRLVNAVSTSRRERGDIDEASPNSTAITCAPSTRARPGEHENEDATCVNDILYRCGCRRTTKLCIDNLGFDNLGERKKLIHIVSTTIGTTFGTEASYTEASYEHVFDWIPTLPTYRGPNFTTVFDRALCTCIWTILDDTKDNRNVYVCTSRECEPEGMRIPDSSNRKTSTILRCSRHVVAEQVSTVALCSGTEPPLLVLVEHTDTQTDVTATAPRGAALL
jgi:hypothetical protein